MAQQNTESWRNYSVVGTFNKLVIILLRFVFGKQRIDNHTDKLNLFKYVLYGFVGICLVVMIRNLYPMFLSSSEVLNLDWKIDSLQAKLVSHSMAIVLMFLLLSGLLLTNFLFNYDFKGENGKKVGNVVKACSIFFSFLLAGLNMYQFSQRNIEQDIDKSKFVKIDLYEDKSSKSIDKQIELLQIAFQNEIATQQQNLKNARLEQERANPSVVGFEKAKEYDSKADNYKAAANVHFIESQNILDKIKTLENKKSENILVLKDQNAQIEVALQSEITWQRILGFLAGGLNELIIFVCLSIINVIESKKVTYNVVKNSVSINQTQNNQSITQTASKPISLPKAPKVRMPKLKKSVKDKISSKFKTLNIFEDLEVATPTQNKVDVSSMINKDVEISEPKELSIEYTTIWSTFKDLGLKSGLITKYTQLKKQDLQNLFRFVVDLDVKNLEGNKMSLKNFASMIEGIYKINQKDLENEVKIMKSNFINKDRLTKSKMLKVSELENEILMSSGQKTLF